MFSIARLQEYLRHSAHHYYQAVENPPFTLFFHPSDPMTFLNYAIPDAPVAGDLREPVGLMRAEFVARHRRPRFEFIEGFAPELAFALEAQGFVQESRTHLMICTREMFRPAPDVPGLSTTKLSPDSTLSDVTDVITT